MFRDGDFIILMPRIQHMKRRQSVRCYMLMVKPPQDRWMQISAR